MDHQWNESNLVAAPSDGYTFVGSMPRRFDSEFSTTIVQAVIIGAGQDATFTTPTVRWTDLFTGHVQ